MPRALQPIQKKMFYRGQLTSRRAKGINLPDIDLATSIPEAIADLQRKIGRRKVQSGRKRSYTTLLAPYTPTLVNKKANVKPHLCYKTRKKFLEMIFTEFEDSDAEEIEGRKSIKEIGQELGIEKK